MSRPLTYPQRRYMERLLGEWAKNTDPRGVYIMGRHDMGIANRLCAQGLLEVRAGSYATPTDAGRAALSAPEAQQ